MKNISLILGLLLLAACANVSTDDESAPTVSSTSQALDADICVTHPQVCAAFERLCARHPALCDQLCAEHPQLPFCVVAGECVEIGHTCRDEEDPNFKPCCDTDAGTADCYLNQSTGVRSCALDTPACEPGAPPLNSECDPNGTPCCPYTGNPFDPPVTCQATDPSDPETSYVCISG